MTVIAPNCHHTVQGALLKSARERMNIISAYHQVGSYRGAAELCGTTHKTVKRVIELAEAGGPPPREPRPRNVDAFAELVATRVEKPRGKMSAKRSCRLPVRPVIRARHVTSAGWWPSRKCCGATLTGISGVPRCGHQVTIW